MKNNKEFGDKLKHIARQALVFANSDYLRLSDDEQNAFRSNKSEQQSEKVYYYLMKKIFKCNREACEDFHDNFTDEQQDIMNHANILTVGIGEDFIDVNDFTPDNDLLLKFPTVYEYDYDNFLYQVKKKKK
ncbi:MAG: hypothetical protein HQL46_16760, partial [Gammaproteobacteria bacterium]|nr:hypothetical protein [Gammaproteobacteria bacterium]